MIIVVEALLCSCYYYYLPKFLFTRPSPCLCWEVAVQGVEDALAYNLGFLCGLWWSGTGGLVPWALRASPLITTGDYSSRGWTREETN